MAKIASALNLKLLPRDLRSKDSRQLLSTIFNQWLSLSTCVIQCVIDIVPSPPTAQAVRLPRMLYPDVFDQEIRPKNKLERDLFSSSSNAGAYITAYVSKMFAVPKKELPENKVRPLTAEELRIRGRATREARKESAPDGVESIAITDTTEGTTDAPEILPVADDEILLGFARLYSGTIKVGTKIYCILPKYSVTLSPDHPANINNIVVAEVEGLYVMMGRELQPVASVRAGNTFAIRGLEGKVWRNTTLCSPGEAGILQDSSRQQDQECLINLGGANRMVLSWACCLRPLIHTKNSCAPDTPYCTRRAGAQESRRHAETGHWTFPSGTGRSVCGDFPATNRRARHSYGRGIALGGVPCVHVLPLHIQ